MIGGCIICTYYNIYICLFVRLPNAEDAPGEMRENASQTGSHNLCFRDFQLSRNRLKGQLGMWRSLKAVEQEAMHMEG